MSRRNKNGPKLELRLNLSPPPSRASQMSLVRSPSRSNTTSPSSCVSSETKQEEEIDTTITSMVLVGCPRCLMYVMLSEDDPKCPKCKSTVLLDFLHQNASAATTAPAANKTRRKKTWWN